MNSHPLVSVIMPVYNAGRYISEAIDSVLEQTYRSLELIIVDDGSTDTSLDIAKRFHSAFIHTYSQRHRGIGAARNLGVERAQGEWLTFIDADDLWPADKIEKQLAAFAAQPNADILFGHTRQFLSPDLPPEEAARKIVPQEPMPGYVAGTMMLRKKTFIDIGPFDTHLRVGEFVDWYSRARDIGLKLALHPDVLLKRRIHSTNTVLSGHNSHYLKALRGIVNRRKGGSLKHG